jgi:hypothetical protein
MSFRKELRLIPRAAWMVAFACYAGFVILIHFLVSSDRGPHGAANWPLAGQLAFNLLVPVIFFIMIPLYGYVYGDAKRRGMRYVMWTLLAIFVPDLIGIILYFILRDSLPADCPTCHTPVLAKFTFCPNCGTSVRPNCPQCGRILESGWVNCAYCGTKVPAHR